MKTLGVGNFFIGFGGRGVFGFFSAAIFRSMLRTCSFTVGLRLATIPGLLRGCFFFSASAAKILLALSNAVSPFLDFGAGGVFGLTCIGFGLTVLFGIKGNFFFS